MSSEEKKDLNQFVKQNFEKKDRLDPFQINSNIENMLILLQDLVKSHKELRQDNQILKEYIQKKEKSYKDEIIDLKFRLQESKLKLYQYEAQNLRQLNKSLRKNEPIPFKPSHTTSINDND